MGQGPPASKKPLPSIESPLLNQDLRTSLNTVLLQQVKDEETKQTNGRGGKSKQRYAAGKKKDNKKDK